MQLQLNLGHVILGIKVKDLDPSHQLFCCWVMIMKKCTRFTTCTYIYIYRYR